MIDRSMNARIALPASIALVLGLLLAAVVVVGTNAPADAQDPAAGCANASPLLLDNGAQVCGVDAQLVPADADCPAGFAPDDSLGGICARFAAAEQLPDRCPQGSQGVAGDCYIRVAKGPRGTLVCGLDGALAGDVCVVEGAPPIRTEDICPSGNGIIDNEEGCYRLVSRDAAGECPSISTEVDGECRVTVELLPGALQCETGFGLVGGRCIAQSAADIPAAECPEDSTEDADGVCRKPVNTAAGAFYCPDPTAALNGLSCVFTAPPVVVDDYVCDQGVFIAGDNLCIIGLLAVGDSKAECAEGEAYLPSPQNDPVCVVAAVEIDDQVCPGGFGPDDVAGGQCVRSEAASQSVSCPRDAVGEAPSCFVVEPKPNGDPEADCPAGSIADADGLCRVPVDPEGGALSCAESTQLIIGGACLALAAFEPPVLSCVDGELIADVALCDIASAELVAFAQAEETSTPTPTSTAAPTPTPTPTATPTAAVSGYNAVAISYPDGGFDPAPTATPGDQVLAAVTAPQAQAAQAAQATPPLAATGTTTPLLLALATALLGIGATLHVGARRAD